MRLLRKYWPALLLAGALLLFWWRVLRRPAPRVRGIVTPGEPTIKSGTSGNAYANMPTRGELETIGGAPVVGLYGLDYS